MDLDIPIDPDLLQADQQYAIDPDLEYAEGALDVQDPLDSGPSQQFLRNPSPSYSPQLDVYTQGEAAIHSNGNRSNRYSGSPSLLRASSSQSRVDILRADYSPFDDLTSAASPSEAQNSYRIRQRLSTRHHLTPPEPSSSSHRSSSKLPKPKSNGKTKPNGNGSVASRSGSSTQRIHTVTRDDYCSFCAGTDERNKLGLPERMTSCHRCGRSGHPSCLQLSHLADRIMAYDWHCIECKTCEICNVKGDDNRLLFCDGCDRGWHSYCLVPPLAKPPKGNWHCANCAPVQRRRNPSPLSLMPSSSKGKEKGRGTEALAPMNVSTPSKLGSSRSRKPLHLEQGNPFNETREKSGNRSGRKRKEFESESEGAPTPPVRIKLRIPSGNHTHVEVESEEEKEPYGGILTGLDADQTRTSIKERDKEQFDRARAKAEIKLGGPPVKSQPQPMPSSPAGSIASDYFPPPLRSQALMQRPLRERLLSNTLPGASPMAEQSPSPVDAGKTTITSQKIKTIRFGPYDIDTWFSAPYPEEYQNVPDGRLWLCEFCLKYMKSGFSAGRHRVKCKARHPPGDEIYRKDTVSVFEVDGRKNKIYCQNLCLLAKMFLDTKTLYYDVEPFLFYVMTEVDDLGARFVGYFSKEKRSPDNNVSCIMTLPVRQRKGWGQLLIDFSYQLSKKEGRVGSPERPLSGLGAVTYRKYWTLALFRYLRNAPDNPTIDEISASTSMTPADIYFTLVNESMIEDLDTPPPDESTPNYSTAKKKLRGRGRTTQIRKGDAPEPETQNIPDRYVIRWDREYIEAVLRKNESRGYLTLAPERLKYHPFLVTRNPIKPPGVIAQATLKVTHGGAMKSGDDPKARYQSTREATAVDDETVKVVQGEDQATLDLVAALSNSPKRSLRERKSEVSMDHESLVVSGTPEQRRRSTRGSSMIKDHEEESDDPLMLGGGNEEASKNVELRNGAVMADIPGGFDADAEGEDDEDGEWEADMDMDAEGEDDEEYVA